MNFPRKYTDYIEIQNRMHLSFTPCKRKGAHIEEKLTIRRARHPPVSLASPVQQGTRYRQLPSKS